MTAKQNKRKTRKAVKTFRYDWPKLNKPAPADGCFVAAEREKSLTNDVKNECRVIERYCSSTDGQFSEDGWAWMRASYHSDSRFVLEGFSESKLYRIPVDRPVRIYCDGVYDIFHYGHTIQLLQAKNLFPKVYLLVGVHNDFETLQNKGTFVMREKERYESVRHCKYIDEVIESAPWVITREFMEDHRIDFVAHDEIPYESPGHDDIYAEAKMLNKFVPTKRTVGISTSEIITRIVRDYGTYLRRQLARGASRTELNISTFKEHEVKIRQRLGYRISGIRDNIQNMLRHWEVLSNMWLVKFLGNFERRQYSWVSRVFILVGGRRVTQRLYGA